MEGQTSVPASVPPAGSVPAAGHPPMPSGPTQRLVYDGRLGELYKIFIVNFLLGLVTLGIYRFWGKTRMRRYLWSHFGYERDRFEYTGTGGELFRGFLVVAAVFFVLALALAGNELVLSIVFADDPMKGMMIGSGINLALYVAFGYLLMAGQYMALRYRLSRTQWRGIRGGLIGSPWKYGLTAFAWVLAIAASLGFAKPVADIALARMRLRNLFFGTAQAKLAPDPGTGGLYGPYVASWFATAAGVLLLYGALIGAFVAAAHFSSSPATDGGSDGPLADIEAWFNDPELKSLAWKVVAGLVVVGIPLWIFVLFVRSWYAAVLFRRIADMVELAGLQPRSTVTTASLWRLVTGNLLISLFTFGFGAPIVLHRLARFTADRLELVGAVDGAAIGQNQQALPGRGEGLLEALDAGGAF